MNASHRHSPASKSPVSNHESSSNPTLFPYHSKAKAQNMTPPQPLSDRVASRVGFMGLETNHHPVKTVLGTDMSREAKHSTATMTAQGTVMVTPATPIPSPTNSDTPSTRLAPGKTRQGSRVFQTAIASESPQHHSQVPQSAKSQTMIHPSQWMITLMLYLLRLLIMGIGLGTLAGTVLAHIDLTALESGERETGQRTSVLSQSLDETPTTMPTRQAIAPGKALPPLQDKFTRLASQYPQLHLGAFFIDLDNFAYANVNGNESYAAASTIKIPVLIAFFAALDANKIHLDETLTMTKDVIGGGSGAMQYQPPGSQFTALETATQMIVISDNTATNMLIERLGGKDELNQRFRSWGLTHTLINNPLPDLPGTNTTSPKDLSHLLMQMSQGKLLSVRSRDWVMRIMRQTKTKTLLPQGLEQDAVISHKTGDIGTALGDAGIIDMPSGKRYVGAVLVKRPHNDYSARTLIQNISRQAYQHFKHYEPRSTLPAATDLDLSKQ